MYRTWSTENTINKNILITGGNGLVGSTITGQLRPTSKELDLRNAGQTYRYFEKKAPTHVIHCAAKVGGLLANIEANGEFFYDNVQINLNVLEACRRYGVKKLVSFLSTCIYPDNVEYPLTEEKIHLGPPHSSNYGYAYAKRMLEVQSRAYNEQHGTKFVTVIPTNIYGPRDNFNIEKGHVIGGLINKCLTAKKNNTEFLVWGSGKPLREFIYSEDIGRLTDWALENYEEADPIIFSNSQEVSIKKLAYLIAETLEFDGPIIFDTNKPDGQFRKPTDNFKLTSLLPDFEFTPIEMGIKKTIDWFISHQSEARK